MNRVIVRARHMAALVVLGTVASGCSLFGGGDTPPEQEAAEMLAECLTTQQEGRLDEAVTCYRKVLEIEANNKFALYNIALIDQQAGRVTEAETGYRAVLDIDAAFAPALFNLAIIRTSPDPAEAEQLYRRVIAVQPDNADAHLNLGFVLREPLCKTEEAKIAFGEAVRLNPSYGQRIPDPESDTCAP